MASTIPKQTDRVLAYMQEHGSINPLNSWRDIGVYRLASRISDLKAKGYEIGKRNRRTVNKYGEVTHFSEYYLKEQEHAN